MELNDLMSLDHVIVVENGIATDDRNHPLRKVWAPEVYVDLDEDGQITDQAEKDMIDDLRREGWYALTGYTGQYCYHGPIMHPSEFIGGGLERDILATDGVYVACEVLSSVTEDNEGDPIGWVVLRLEKD